MNLTLPYFCILKIVASATLTLFGLSCLLAILLNARLFIPANHSNFIRTLYWLVLLSLASTWFHRFVVEDWENASAVARVFNIGRSEAGAVSALQSKIHADVTRMLKAAVAMRGMRTFITHDLIHKGAFNEGFTSGQGPTEAWAQEFTNGHGQQLVSWLP